jgi:hypothetical protein
VFQLTPAPPSTNCSTMGIPRGSLRLLAGAAGAVLLACGEPKSRAVNDSAQAAMRPEGTVASGRAGYLWDPNALGAFFVVPAEEPLRGYLINPLYDAEQSLDTLDFDERRLRGVDVELFSGAEASGRARLVGLSRDTTAGCLLWPEVRLEGEGLPERWQVGFPVGVALTIPVDSLPLMNQRDSLHLTIAIARAMSRLPGDTVTAFRGRPFVVRQALRFQLDHPGVTVVVAEVVRSVSQEANPIVEQTLAILEQITADTLLRPAYFERTTGREEELEGIDIVAVLALSNGAAVLMRREAEGALAFALYQRLGSGHWQLRWRSASATC